MIPVAGSAYTYTYSVMGEFLAYARKHRGVVFARKDQIAQWAITMNDVPSKTY